MTHGRKVFSARQMFALAAVLSFLQADRLCASSIYGFNSNGDVYNSASGSLTADDSVVITIDNNMDGAGAFTVYDRTGGGLATVISGDGGSLTLGSNATTVSGTLGVSGNMTASGTLGVTGNITATGAANTIGTAGSANTLTGASNSLSATNTNSITATISNTMTSDLNVIGNNANYATATEAIKVDGGTGVSIKGAAFEVNTANTVATANTIGSNNSGTTVALAGGNSSLAIANNTALTAVTGGASVLGPGTTSSDVSLVNKGGTATHAVADGNGRISMVNTAAAEASASVTLTNGLGNTHGMVVTESKTVLSGGTHSTSLTLDDSGATFRNSAGDPARVTGVADGSSDYDAINVRQLKQAFSGIASVAALAAIPAPPPGDNFSVGMGYGHFKGENAMAVGLKGRVLENMTVSGGLGYGTTDSTVTPNLGISFSW